MADPQDSVWLDILPSMAGFSKTLTKETTKAATTAGKTAGDSWSKAFDQGADGASSAMVNELSEAQRKSSALVTKLSGDVSNARQAQKRAVAGVLDAEERLASARAKYGDNSNQAAAAELRLDAARDKAAQATTKFQRAEAALKDEQRAHKTITGQLEDAQKDLNAETDKAPGLWDRVTGSLKTAGSGLKDFASSTGGALAGLAGMAGGAALFVDTWNEALDGEFVTDKMNAALAATPEQAERYGKVAGNLYSSGYGESMGDVTKSVDAVVSSMAGMRDASESDIQAITEKALAMSDVFEVDVAEASSTAGTLMKNGLAADASTAMDLIVGAMNQVPQGVRGEILPVMSEYSKHFAALGIDGETAMGMIIASSADGAIGMDKMGDALKEFTIRGTDMSKSTVAAYESMGLSAEQMTNDLLAGGTTAEGAMAKIVHGLQSIEDPGAQAAAAISLFGTPLEDLGTDQIPAFLGMVDPMGDAFDSTKGAADELTATLNDNTATTLEATKRKFQDLLVDGLTPVLPVLNDFITWATDTPAFMPAVLTGLGLLAAGFVALGVSAAVSAVAASPWIGVAALIGAAVAAVTVVVLNWGNIMGWLGGVFTSIWREHLKPVWDQVAAVASSVWNRTLGPVFQAIGDGWSRMVSWVSGIWNQTGKPMFEAVGSVASWLWQHVLSPTFENISAAWQLSIDVIRFAWSKYGKPLFDAVGSIVSALYREKVEPVFRWIGDAWGGMINGIRDLYQGVLKPVLQNLGDFIADHVVRKFQAGVDMLGRAWAGLKNLFAGPINWVLTNVWNNGLVKAFNSVAEAVGSSQRLGKAGLIATGDPNSKRGNRKGAGGVTTVGAYAKGGFVSEEWYLAGEQGPELIHRGSDSHRVYTAAETAMALAMGQDLSPELSRRAAGSSPRQALAPMGDFDWGHAIGEVLGTNQIARGAQAASATIGSLFEHATNLINPWIDRARAEVGGAGMLGSLLVGAARTAASGLFGWARKEDEAAVAGGEWGGPQFAGVRGGFARPSRGPITSRFGPRWGTTHAGVDIAGGGPTFAAWNGRVAKTGWNIGPGRTGLGILLSHGADLWSYYGHNPVGGIKVRPGQEVKAGQHIGYQGATGNVTGVHLHWETHQGAPWKAVNPGRYLYDDGGWMQPGDGAYRNATGTPEAVLTSSQWSTMGQLAAIATQSLAHGAGGFGGQMYLVVDGEKFKAYVVRTGDERLEQHVKGAEQINRQMAGV